VTLLHLQKLRNQHPPVPSGNDDAYVWRFIWFLVYYEIQHEMLLSFWKQDRNVGELGYSWQRSRLVSRVTLAL